MTHTVPCADCKTDSAIPLRLLGGGVFFCCDRYRCDLCGVPVDVVLRQETSERMWVCQRHKINPKSKGSYVGTVPADVECGVCGGSKHSKWLSECNSPVHVPLVENPHAGYRASTFIPERKI